MSIKEEILQSIGLLIDKKLETYKADTTFVSVIKQVNSNGTYIINDQSGTSRTVKCAIPNITLSNGQAVYVKIPCGNLKKIHICGVV